MIPPLHIIVDSRESAPWSWTPDVATVEIAGLVAGDYCLAEDCEIPKRKGALRPVRFALERKSLNDFVNSVSADYDRFMREMDRATLWPARIVIGEFDFEDLCFSEVGNEILPPQHNHPCIRPSFMLRRLSELAMANIQVYMCGDAQGAAAMALHLFRRRRDTINGVQ